MRIKKLGKDIYAIIYKGEYYYGELEQVLNEALVSVFFPKIFGSVTGSHIGNYPLGYNNEGTNIGRDW